MNGSPSLSKTEFLILGLLVRQPEMYGLEMVKKCSRLKRGTVYVLLGRLEEKGFISSKQATEPGRSGLPRRLYSLTARGAEAYQAVHPVSTLLGFPKLGEAM